MAVNKVEYAGKVLLDLTEDTVTADMMESGVKAHDKTGALITGSIPVNDMLTYAAISESDLDYIKTHTSYGELCVVTINSNIYPKNEETRLMVTLMKLQNHSGVVRLQLFTLLMAQIIINQHIMVHQLQQISRLVFLVEN